MNEWAILKYTYKNPLSLIDAELTAFIILLTSVFLTFSFITLCSKVCVLYAEGHSGKMTYTLGFFFLALQSLSLHRLPCENEENAS